LAVIDYFNITEGDKMKKTEIRNYIEKNDWRVKENSNASYSYAGLQGHIAGTEIAKYTLDNIYTKEIADAHRNCFIHLHDLSNGIVGYCAGFSLKDLIIEGFNCDVRFIYSKPAKHLPAILGQMENFLFTLSQEWAGAIAFNSVDTLLAPFIKKDNMTYKQVEQELQQHIFNLNNKYRISFQTPFSNYSFDLVVPEDLKNEPAIVAGVEQDFTYGDCQKEMDIFNKAFIQVISEGDGMGKPFSFPIPTYSITKDFNWDNTLAQKLFKMAGKTGAPYFSNFINSDLDPSDVRSMCCRLSLDLRELRKNSSGLF
jgi:anaerobic ribonucleoside-triphosphate reductase